MVSGERCRKCGKPAENEVGRRLSDGEHEEARKILEWSKGFGHLPTKCLELPVQFYCDKCIPRDVVLEDVHDS